MNADRPDFAAEDKRSASFRFAEALAKGTPNVRKIALTAVSDKVQEIIQAIPSDNRHVEV